MNCRLTLFRIFGVLHLGHALQAFRYLMEAALTAVQLQIGLLAGLVEEILADEPASVVGDVAAATFGLLALLQAEEELGLVARTTGLAQVVRGARQGAGCATRGILSETAASSTYPVLVPPELYKNSNDSVFRGDIVADSAATRAILTIQRRVHAGPEVHLRKKKRIRT